MTNEEFAKTLKHKQGDIIHIKGVMFTIDRVDYSAHGDDNSCLPYLCSMWFSEDDIDD